MQQKCLYNKIMSNVSHSVKKMLNESISDGWELEDKIELDILGDLNNLIYEINNCQRGAYTNCVTYKDLANYINNLAEQLHDTADLIEDLEEPEEEEFESARPARHAKKLNEGAGAGYDLILKGLDACNIKITKQDSDTICFTAKLCEKEIEWSATGYYAAVSSDGICDSNGYTIMEYDRDDCTVTGGYMKGSVNTSDVEDEFGDDFTKADILAYLKDKLTDFKIKKMIGAGWIHVNLSNPIVLEDLQTEIEDSYYNTAEVQIDSITIEAEAIVNNINWFFAHSDELERDDIDD